MQSVNHNDIGRDRAAIDAALLEYKREFPRLCRDLGVTPAMLASIEPSVLMALFFIRVVSRLEERVNALSDAQASLINRVRAAESRASAARAGESHG